MAEEIEIFNILDDGSGDGDAPDGRKRGEGYSTAEGLVAFNAEDASNNVDLLQIQAEGSAVPTKGQAIMPAKDESGDLQYMPMSGGAIVVTNDGAGTIISSHSGGTTATVGSYSGVMSLTLTIGKTYTDLELNVSSFKDCAWKIEYVDDSGGGGEVITAVYPRRVRTGAGSYTFIGFFENFELDTTGGTGLQELLLSVEQRSGTGASFDASMAVKELP